MVHHYVLTATELQGEATSHYQLEFTNESTGKQVMVTVPRMGAYEDPNRELRDNEVDRLANQLATLFKKFFVDKPPAKSRGR